MENNPNIAGNHEALKEGTFSFRAQELSEFTGTKNSSYYDSIRQKSHAYSLSQTHGQLSHINSKQNDSQTLKIEQGPNPDDFVKDFEHNQRSDIKRQNVMATYHAKKASLGDQAKITRFSNPNEQKNKSRSTSPLEGNEAPLPRNLPSLLSNDYPLNDEVIEAKYITALSARNESDRAQNKKEQLPGHTKNKKSILKGSRLESVRDNLAENYMSFDRHE